MFRRERILSILSKSIVVTAALAFFQMTASADDVRNVPILYPKNNSVVGKKVNVVLDPADVPYFQVIVNKTEYPVVDTSTGAHAYQGVQLEQGKNIIIVNVLKVENAKEKKTMSIVGSRSLTVFNREGSFSPVPAGFTQDPFHTRERESSCGTCHRMEATSQDVKHDKPEEVLCYTCHREMPKGAHIHGPAALWNCLSCHNPDIYPVKYAFSSVDPWKVTKSTKAVEPAVFTVSTLTFFKPGSAAIVSKEKVQVALEPMLNFAKENSTYRIRLEVHSDPLPPQKLKSGKAKGFKDSMALTSARAKSLAAFLKGAGVPSKRVSAVGMGEKMPKAPNDTQAGRDLNNRSEIVVYPPDVKVVNSSQLPVLKDRERVTVTVAYRGPQIKKLRVVEKVPKNTNYVRGSGIIRGRFAEPKQTGNELIWDLNSVDQNFNESVSYILRKMPGAENIPASTKVSFLAADREQSRILDPAAPASEGLTVKQTCLKCHETILDKPFKHGPVDAGYCSLCHDPHASPNSAWIRKPTWELCTTCHAQHGTGVHVVAGFVKGQSHPTKGKKDPARPGKRLSCSSCHEPHSSQGQNLFAYNVKNRPDLCAVCHRKK